MRVAEYHTHGGLPDFSTAFHNSPGGAWTFFFKGTGAFYGDDYTKYSSGKYGEVSYLATPRGNYFKFYAKADREVQLWPQ